MSATRVIIVVPCYNESGRLDVRSYRRCATAMPHVQFLFVDDGSTDATATIIDELHRASPGSFGVLHLRTNMGKAEAVRAGVLAASGMNVELVGYWDADLATPLTALPAFCAILDECTEIDLVIGSRVRLLGRRIERRTARHYAGRVFATLASVALGVPVYDTQCGAKLFRCSERMRQVFAEPFQSRWIFDVEILARFIAARRAVGLESLGDAVYELPLAEWRDVEGSKLRLIDFATAWLSLGVIYWRYIRTGAPPVSRSAVRSGVVLPAGADGAVSPVASRHSRDFLAMR